MSRDDAVWRWDEIRAELFDTIQAQPKARPRRPCIYCSTPTRALSGVCCAHSDLPHLDPHLNIQAGRYSQAAA